MIIPGDILWSRFRVTRVEAERVDAAWLRNVNANDDAGKPSEPTHVLLALQPPASTAMGEVLAALWPGANPSKEWLANFAIDAASASSTELRARLPLIGEVEWRGSPHAGGVALVQLADALAIEQFQRENRSAITPQTALGWTIDLCESLDALLHSTRRNPHDIERFCSAAVKILNSGSIGVLRDRSKLVVVPRVDERPATLSPPEWTIFAAPEAIAGEHIGESALVFGIARLIQTLLCNPHDSGAKAAQLLPLGWERLAVRDIAFREFKRDPRAAEVPRDLRALLAKCLRPRPAGRFATIAKLKSALKKLQRALLSEEAPAPPATSAQHPLAIRPPMPDGMVFVEAGQYLSGEKKQPRTLRAYLIDVAPVTEKTYRDFLKEAGREPAEGGPGSRGTKFDKHPVVNITWREAEEYAEHYGKRLPTIYEWEKAARGKDGRKFPYGNEFVPNTGKLRAISSNGPPGKDGTKETSPVGIFPKGASPYGALDMAGNVLEWTSTARRQGD